MNSTLKSDLSATTDPSVVATYKSHADAEGAVRQLAAGGIPMPIISIIGRNFETHEDIQGFYRPEDAAVDGAKQGAWFGGLFGLMMGAMGFFIFPIVGGVMAIGPIAGLIAGAIGGAGVGALMTSLMTIGVPREQALKYQEQIKAGEFLVVVHGDAQRVSQAQDILAATPHSGIQSSSLWA
jgi:hypothetical protein